MFHAVESRMTVRFVAFVNEEPPFFMTEQQGSAVYAKECRRRGDDIRLMVSLETIGCYSQAPDSQSYPPLFRYFFPDRGNFIGIVSDFPSRTVLRRLAKAFRMRSDFPLETVSTFRFIPGGVERPPIILAPGLSCRMVTDTAFYRYPHTTLRRIHPTSSPTRNSRRLRSAGLNRAHWSPARALVSPAPNCAQGLLNRRRLPEKWATGH
jgi:hypothetical protein